MTASLHPDRHADFWAQTFGRFIEGARTSAGRSIEQAAERAGVPFTDWLAMEAGIQVPSTRSGLEIVAEAAGMKWSEMVGVVLLCRNVWGI